MNEINLLSLVFEVIKNPYTIGTTIVVIMLMNFCCFVANYRKKPPMPKKAKKVSAPKAEAKPAENANVSQPAENAEQAPADEAKE